MRYYRSLVYMPKNIPALRDMLADIGNPTPKEVAKALKVTERTVWRWLREDKAPHSAMLAIYWLTTWGISEIDTSAHNAAIYSAGRARCLQEELEAIQAQLARLSQIGDFGSSNDPGRGAMSNQRLQVLAKTGGVADSELLGKPGKPPVESEQPPAVEPSIHAGFRGYGS